MNDTSCKGSYASINILKGIFVQHLHPLVCMLTACNNSSSEDVCSQRQPGHLQLKRQVSNLTRVPIMQMSQSSQRVFFLQVLFH